jgi:arylsulfatase
MRIYLFLAILLFNIQKGNTQSKDTRPNIIVILADDLGFSDLGCYGSEIPTPNLDKLAEKGLKFTQFYNAGRCCPSRAALLTGMYPHQVGMGGMTKSIAKSTSGPYQGYLDFKKPTIAEIFKSNGYNTYMSGKWHVGGIMVWFLEQTVILKCFLIEFS